jgi:hypothetical protein
MVLMGFIDSICKGLHFLAHILPCLEVIANLSNRQIAVRGSVVDITGQAFLKLGFVDDGIIHGYSSCGVLPLIIVSPVDYS